MGDNPRFTEIADLCQNLTQIEFIWFLGWNIADGRWGPIGLEEMAGRGLLLDLFSKLHRGGSLEVLKESSGRLQQLLMSSRRGTFEEIQQESPFSRHAKHNMEALLKAWKEQGESGFTPAWERTFPEVWDAAQYPQDPIRIIGEAGDCKERALLPTSASTTSRFCRKAKSRSIFGCPVRRKDAMTGVNGMGIQAVLFDFDFTLADPSAWLMPAWIEALGTIGEPRPNDAILRRVVGRPLAAQYSLIVGETASGVRFERFEHSYLQYRDGHASAETMIFTGVAAMLETLDKSGMASELYRQARPSV